MDNQRSDIRRVAMLSAHTSPLEQPGGGDAGGMNVYVLELSRQLARRGIEVEIFTRATSRHQPAVHQAEPGIVVHHVTAGPYEGLQKNDLPSQLCSFVRDVLRVEVEKDPGHFDLVHSHYWLSGSVGTVASERWDVPLVHTMHTMAKVKNLALASGDTPEPQAREIGETQVVAAADRLVANTDEEADQLIRLYDADPGSVVTVPPGVDLDVFSPGSQAAARRRLGIADDAYVLLFVGRIQPLKAPDLLLHAAARLVALRPSLRERLVVAVVGGPSGRGCAQPESLTSLAADLGIADLVRFVPPVAQSALPQWYRAADVTVVPSYSESFGLVAIESQACGTPVLAASVGGLRTAVSDGESGVLLDGHDPDHYARILANLDAAPAIRRELGRGAVEHAARFGWGATAAQMLRVYDEAIVERSEAAGLVVNR